jgi:hypothetical protein
MRTPVYVLSGSPSSAEAPSATSFTRGARCVASSAAARVVTPPLAPSSHEPTLIGEVGLKTRNMLRNRSGRPRSAIRSGGATSSAARLV